MSDRLSVGLTRPLQGGLKQVSDGSAGGRCRGASPRRRHGAVVVNFFFDM